MSWTWGKFPSFPMNMRQLPLLQTIRFFLQKPIHRCFLSQLRWWWRLMKPSYKTWSPGCPKIPIISLPFSPWFSQNLLHMFPSFSQHVPTIFPHFPSSSHHLHILSLTFSQPFPFPNPFPHRFPAKSPSFPLPHRPRSRGRSPAPSRAKSPRPRARPKRTWNHPGSPYGWIWMGVHFYGWFSQLIVIIERIERIERVVWFMVVSWNGVPPNHLTFR